MGSAHSSAFTASTTACSRIGSASALALALALPKAALASRAAAAKERIFPRVRLGQFEIRLCAGTHKSQANRHAPATCVLPAAAAAPRRPVEDPEQNSDLLVSRIE